MFTVSSLVQPDLARASVNHETYKQLWQNCVNHIRRRHGARCGDALWQVPEHVLGRPPYTHAHAVRYVSEKLRAGGFDVKVMEAGIIHVNWARQVTKHVAKKVQESARSDMPPRKKRVPPKDEPLSVRLERLAAKLKAPGSQK